MTAAWPLGLALLALGLWRVDRAARAANGADWGRGWLNWLDGFNRLFCRRWHRLHGDRIALPAEGGAIVVANHLSGLDPLLLIAACNRPLHFMIASEEYNRYGLTWLFRAVGCIPVDRSGRPERALRAAVRALEQGHVVALFPHGRIHLPGDAHHRLRPGAVWLGVASGSPLYPVHLAGVRGQGKTVLAVVPRSRARLTLHAPIDAKALGLKPALHLLEELLNARSEA